MKAYLSLPDNNAIIRTAFCSTEDGEKFIILEMKDAEAAKQSNRFVNRWIQADKIIFEVEHQFIIELLDENEIKITGNLSDSIDYLKHLSLLSKQEINLIQNSAEIETILDRDIPSITLSR